MTTLAELALAGLPLDLTIVPEFMKGERSPLYIRPSLRRSNVPAFSNTACWLTSISPLTHVAVRPTGLTKRMPSRRYAFPPLIVVPPFAVRLPWPPTP